MDEKEIKELVQRFYSLYCNCQMKDERMIYLNISNKLSELLMFKSPVYKNQDK